MGQHPTNVLQNKKEDARDVHILTRLDLDIRIGLVNSIGFRISLKFLENFKMT